MDKKQYIKNLAELYFNGKIQPAQEKELFEFINSNGKNMAIFREWEKEWIASTINDSELNLAWDRMSSRMKVKKSVSEIKIPSAKRFHYRQLLSIAASFLLVLGFSYYCYNYYQIQNNEAYFENEVPYGEKSKIILADGSTVWLNSGSTLRYSTNFNNKNRSVILEGEGYFEITKKGGLPFKVLTNEYEIVVKGTKFNVTAYNDDPYISTTLIEGKVEVNYKDKTYVMNPGEEMKLDKATGEMQQGIINASHINSWINNYIEYDNITLQELMTKLSRRFNANIIIRNPKLNDQRFNISLRNDETLDQILKAIQKIIPVNVQKENQKYIIN